MMRFLSVRVTFSASFFLLLAALLTGCDYNGNGAKIVGEWENQEGHAAGKVLPAGVMRMEFESNGRMTWKLGFFNISGKYSFQGDMLYLTLDRPAPGTTATKMRSNITFNGKDHFTMEDRGSDQAMQGRVDFVRVAGAPSGGGNIPKMSDLNIIPSDVDTGTPNITPSIPQMPDTKMPWGSSPDTSSSPDTPSSPDISSSPGPRRSFAPEDPMKIKPAYSGDELGTPSATAAQPLYLDLSMRKPCVISKDLNNVVVSGNTIPTGMTNDPWNVKIQPVVRKPYTDPPKPITLDIRGSDIAGLFITKPEQILCSEQEENRIALVSWNRGLQDSTWVNIVSLDKGKAVARQLGFKCKFFDISPNGKYAAATASTGNGAVSSNVLLVLRIDDASCQPMLIMTPFDDAPDNQKQGKTVQISEVRWLDNRRLILSSEQRVIVCLDVSNQTLQYGISGSPLVGRDGFMGHWVRFELTPDRKYLITELNGTPGVVFDTATGTRVGTFRADNLQKIAANEILFSPDGRSFISQNGWIWDCTTGYASHQLSSFSLFADRDGGWISLPYIINMNSLVQAQDGTNVVRYQSTPDRYAVVGDQLAYVAENKYYRPKSIPMLVIGNPVPPAERISSGEPIEGRFTVSGIEFN